MAIPSVYAGTDFMATATFKNVLGVLTDPATVIMGYIPGPNGSSITSTYNVGGSTIVRVNIGIYSWIITPPESGPYGLWTVEVRGDGTIDVVNPTQVLVLRPPMIL